jgi:hypothetical protein
MLNILSNTLILAHGSDQLTMIPTQIVQEFVTHYEKRKKFEALEACITHLSVMCLDIHQVITDNKIIEGPSFFQCCGTGTVGTVTFCLVEPEP